MDKIIKCKRFFILEYHKQRMEYQFTSSEKTLTEACRYKQPWRKIKNKKIWALIIVALPALDIPRAV